MRYFCRHCKVSPSITCLLKYFKTFSRHLVLVSFSEAKKSFAEIVSEITFLYVTEKEIKIF